MDLQKSTTLLVKNRDIYSGVYNKRYDIVKRALLCGGNANTNISYDGEMPLDRAIKNYDIEMIQILITHGAHITNDNYSNITNLYGEKCVQSWLLERIQKVFQITKQNNIPRVFNKCIANYLFAQIDEDSRSYSLSSNIL